jgi:L-ribulose-5-phosphate 3-epimerase
MKKSISYWAFPGGLAGAKPIGEAMTEAKNAGFEAIELAAGETGALSLSSTQKDCKEIRKQADAIGIGIASVATGIFWSYNYSSPAAADRRKAESATKKMLQIAAWLGTDALLVVPGAVDVFFDPNSPVVQADVVMQRAQECIQNCVSTAEKVKVSIAVENVWNKFLYSPTEMRYFVDTFKSEFVGAYFDVGNVIPYGYPEQWIRILGKRIKRIHLKDFKAAVGNANGFCDLLEGDVNWPEVIKALKEIGYDGPLTAEVFPWKHYPEVLVKNTSCAMDAILGRK